jgi:L-alanine-DL-glutamate epimerase-like enolase superfamily enzyme
MKLRAWLLRLPLVTPYKLAFGPVEALDTVIVHLEHAGAEGFGEATLLTGYTDETIGETWEKARQLVEAAASPTFSLVPALDVLDAKHPFLTTAFRTALEMAQRDPRLAFDHAVRVPILGLLQGETIPELERETERLLAEGYGTVKVKVGFDPGRDARVVAMAQHAVAGRMRIRIDANQGFDAEQAVEFVSSLAPDSIELFEQPCKAGDWDSHMKVVPAARSRGIALMLDESIYSVDDIERAAELDAAAYVKVKLMKFSGLARLEAAIERIRSFGLKPVLGNGVAADVGCWMEACIAARHIDNAGEMNGFLKPRERLLADRLAFSGGAIEIPARWRARLDEARLARLAVESAASA